MKKKIVALISVILITSFLLGSSVTACPIYGRLPKGNPFQELWEAIFGVQDDVANLQAQVADLQAQIDALEPETPMGLPVADYDSGWVQIWDPTWDEPLLGLRIEHNLGTQDLFVYAYSDYVTDTGHRTMSFLFDEFGMGRSEFQWITQTLDANTVDVTYEERPFAGPGFEIYVRVLVWKIP